MGAGTSKSGWPIERLIGFLSEAANSNTFRIPLESKAKVRFAIQEGWLVDDMFVFEFMMGDCLGDNDKD
jgi:hypothetical protein